MDNNRNYRSVSIRNYFIQTILLISLTFLLISCLTPKNDAKNSKVEQIIYERIIDNSFEIKEVATIKPIYENELKPFIFQNYTSELNTEIKKDDKNKSNKKAIKKDSLFIKYNHLTNEFNILVKAEADTLRDTTKTEIKIIEVEKNVTNWYLIGLGIVALILLLIFLIKNK